MPTVKPKPAAKPEAPKAGPPTYAELTSRLNYAATEARILIDQFLPSSSSHLFPPDEFGREPIEADKFTPVEVQVARDEMLISAAGFLSDYFAKLRTEVAR